jgi:hypothetical protein
MSGGVAGSEGTIAPSPPTVLRDANNDYFSRSVRWHGIGGTGAGTKPTPSSRIHST